LLLAGILIHLRLEEIIVLGTHRFIGSLLLTGAIFAPTAIMSAALPQEGIQVRVYDSHHHDYHNWDDREDHAYRGYLVEHHRSYRSYDQQRARDQRNYWKWRHQHPDHD
jgi:hypothetical protein